MNEVLVWVWHDVKCLCGVVWYVPPDDRHGPAALAALLLLVIGDVIRRSALNIT